MLPINAPQGSILPHPKDVMYVGHIERCYRFEPNCTTLSLVALEKRRADELPLRATSCHELLDMMRMDVRRGVLHTADAAPRSARRRSCSSMHRSASSAHAGFSSLHMA